MDLELAKNFITQALAMGMNYLKTGRGNKAIEVVSQALKIDPENEIGRDVMHYIAFGGPRTALLKSFMGDWWGGQPLDGKSIEVFCDQGMGDTIQLLRYLKVMKERWGCRIVVNYYAFHREMRRLLESQPYIDKFVPFHESCDYYTNIMSVPAMLNGIMLEVYYPTMFHKILNTPIPEQPSLGTFKTPLRDEGFRVGLAWHSNMENPIGQKKSIPIEKFAPLEDGVNEMFSLLPSADKVNFMVQLPIHDIVDTANIIEGCHVVVSVDTAVLHLAGSMGKPTLGLLPHEADDRWGLGKSTVWYPTVELFRQPADKNWEPVIQDVKERLVSLRGLR